MPEFALLNDVSKCMGCKSCQIACKSWNGLPGEKTSQSGSYQNPPDLNANTWTLVHYNEIIDEKGRLKWLFRKEQCFHCRDAACADVCPAPGAIFKTKEGAVVIDQDKCIGCKYCINACPYGIPRFNDATQKVTKCTFCYDRLQANMVPACAKACPSHAIIFGERSRVIELGKQRVKELGGDAMLYGENYIGGEHFMYVLPEKPAMYAGMIVNPTYPLTVTLWRSVVRPFSLAAFLGSIGVAWLYYITKGPKRPDKEVSDEQQKQ
jgi:formate dehydrogenase iron-sulfur subunit